jgi:predicted short-subunit dehydrogenase-like oxidoreductase (DUF2520 family)
MKKVSFIGSGNVATHLAKGFNDKGIQIKQVFSLNLSKAELLANSVNAEGINDIALLETDGVDLIVLSVKDDVIEEIAQKFDSKNATVVHTSGTVSIKSLATHKKHGVLYPLQTFSKLKEMDLSNIPFCVEGNSKQVCIELIDFSAVLSNDVRKVDSLARKSIHLSAVFACNFTNHMLAVGDRILQESNQDISILKPLVEETIKKALSSNPEDVQTGPAIRKDYDVLEQHINRLEANPLLQNIYKDITESIINWKNNE